MRNMPKDQFDELSDLLGLEVEVELGHDDFIHGNYIEVPYASSIDPDVIPKVLAILGTPLPFGESVTIDFLDSIYEFPVEDKSLIIDALGDPSWSWDDISGAILRFPELNTDSEQIHILLNELLPSGILYEQELPAYLHFWQPDPELVDDEYWDPLPISSILKEIRNLRQNCINSPEPTVKKAAVLASFSLIESQTRQRIIRNVPKFPRQPEFQKYMTNFLRRETEKAYSREKLLKAIEPTGSWDGTICHWGLRNALAHDLDSVSCENNELIYTDRHKSEQQNISCDLLFEHLITHIKENLA